MTFVEQDSANSLCSNRSKRNVTDPALAVELDGLHLLAQLPRQLLLVLICLSCLQYLHSTCQASSSDTTGCTIFVIVARVSRTSPFLKEQITHSAMDATERR